MIHAQYSDPYNSMHQICHFTSFIRKFQVQFAGERLLLLLLLFLLLNGALGIAILHFISPVHLAPFVIMPPNS